MAARFLIVLLCVTASAQLPPSGTIPDSVWPEVRAEIARINTLLASAPDKDTVTYLMALTWATAKQWPQTIVWLRKVAARKTGLDPARDSRFSELRGTREFAEILAAVREATPPISHSKPAFKVHEGDLVPESLAYDSAGEHFYFGSIKKGKVLRCSTSGNCTNFALGLGEILGLKVHANGLWLLSNKAGESALVHFDLRSASAIQRYVVTGAGHKFNDLAFTLSGDVYLTDTRAGAVWQLKNGATDLTRFPQHFESANGIALSPDAALLYVSTFPDGIRVVDLRTNADSPIGRPADLCLATIDGLYFHGNSLIAIQNAFMVPRVIRLTLTRDLRSIERFEVLERRNPLFDGVTTGVIAGSDFFFMANIQDEKKSGFNPITILKLPL